MKTVYIVGVDPGLDGAFVWLIGGEASQLAPIDMPVLTIKKGKSTKRNYNIPALLEIAQNFGIDIPEDILWVIEDVHAMPKQGVTGMFNFGRGKGLLEMLPFTIQNSSSALISPQKWKRHFDLLGKDKEASIELANKLGFETKKSGQADAFLIGRAYYEIYLKE
jgi:crossover junction endodeoxyribonuclease RuvC